MEEILKAISTVGFPIVVTVYILTRIEPRLNKLNTQNIVKWNGQVIRKWNGLE